MSTTNPASQPDPAAQAPAPARATRVARAPRKPATAASAPTPRKRTSAPKATAAPVPEKEAKAKKPKLVRDSFTFPKDEYGAVEALKLRAAQLSQPAKKSEILRAGLKALTGMSDAALRTALQAVPAIKTGRPKSEK